MAERIESPIIGSVVKHTGWKQDEKIYPCDVYIESGCYLDSTYGRVSNFWYWKRVLKDGSLAKTEHGYGSFEKSKKNYEIETRVKSVG